MSDEDWAAAVENQESTLATKVKDLVINTSAEKTTPAPQPGPPPQKEEKPPANENDSDNSLVQQSLMAKFLHNKLVESTKEVEVQKKDPTSPLYSVKSFEELPLKDNLRKGVYNMGFNSPSKIQETALPMLLADPPNNMIAQSQSGTGKTAAFVLTMLSRVDPTKDYPQVLCLAPTYELALQIGDVVKKMAQFCPEIEVAFAVRGNRVNRGEKIKSHILIGTPGTMLDWILRFRVFDPKKIKVFVLDEADVMIDTQGHQDQSIRIHKTLGNKDCQMLLFSATYTDKVMKFAEVIVPDPVIIRLRREEESLVNIRQFYAECKSKEDKYEALGNMYGMVSIGQCIVFCHTRKSAAWLAEKMTADGHAVALLSGDITVEQRLAVITRFREAKEKLLITTNVCARGIDIEQVTVVVNYDLPELDGKADYETYLHRIGRTGRFGKTGLAINYVDGERSMQMLRDIEKHFGKKIEKLDYTDMDDLEKLN